MSYEAGEQVRVSDRMHVGHHRTPAYVKGKTGTVERAQSSFANPETRAYGTDGLPARALYLVAFEQGDLWPEYGGSGADRLYADVFEQWLEPAG